MKNPIIEVHNLTVSYNKRPVLWDVDYELPPGQLIGVLGPNGSGKTTMLKTIMGLIRPDSGFVEVMGKKLDEVRDKVSYVPQRESVDWDFPANVMDVVLMGRYNPKHMFRRLSKEDRELAVAALEKVNMLPFAERQISQLSGGQQQRVFIARALARQADLYLMDEPFAGVDAASEESILELLTGMKAEGKSIMVVHHDLQTARNFFDWIILLNTSLVASGPVNEVFTEQNLQAAYGGKLTVLSQIADLVASKAFPLREKGLQDREKL
ncbi:MAG: metal ABC transporter ATP-binding protein [Bacteroidia bacterium]|nr:metal ABC transporter ATP-binding protein [Bacteroidia bacterium]